MKIVELNLVRLFSQYPVSAWLFIRNMFIIDDKFYI